MSNAINSFSISPIARVLCQRKSAEDDHWGEVISQIVLNDNYPDESWQGLDSFSHIQVVYHFHLLAEERIHTGLARPRGNPEWPMVGIFAQRKKSRPNRIGVSYCQLLEVNGRILSVRGLDAIDQSPVIDIKPVMKEFLPLGEIHQPKWSQELMKNYWE